MIIVAREGPEALNILKEHLYERTRNVKNERNELGAAGVSRTAGCDHISVICCALVEPLFVCFVKTMR